MKTPILLGTLFTVQLVLAAGLYIGGGTTTPEPQPLLDFATAEIDRIVIDDNSNNSTTTLQRKDAAWRLPDTNLPANDSKVRTLLDNLSTLQTRWPVVSTAAGQERLEVTEERFQRRLRLYRGETLLGEYFFGTSPAFRQTHARRAGDDEVHALAFNNFDLPGDSNDWLDKTLLGAGAPTSIKGPDFALTRDGDEWQLADGTDSAVQAMINQSEVDELADALASLRVLRAETAPEGETVTFDISTDAGQWEYRFTKADSKYYVQRSDQPQSFTISQGDYDRIAGKSRDEIVSNDGASVTPAEGESTDEKV